MKKKEKDLELIYIVSGKTRRNSYSNGDVVINNTALYCIRHYTGELKWNEESKEMKFFDLNNLPKDDNDNVDFSKDFFGKSAHLTVSRTVKC